MSQAATQPAQAAAPDGKPSEAMFLLRQIAADVRAIRLVTDALLHLGGGGGASAAPGPRVASDFDMDGQYGNPTVNFVPPQWKGEPQNLKGLRYSDCPPAFLDVFAAFKDSCADRDEETGKLTQKGKPAAPYARRDAALARGWARRLRTPVVPERENGKGDAYEPDQPDTNHGPAATADEPDDY